MGLFPELKVEESHMDLRPGDILVAFSDGVPEALNTAKEEFGEERIQELLRRSIDCSAQEVSTRLSEAVKSWMAGAEQHDDVTVVVMKV
jgi:serine phosphatase RsbU (regulator of sigma subunit)